MVVEYNPKLATWLKNEPSDEAGINNIQMPGRTENIVWQTRYREPSRYEQALVKTLEEIFGSGVVELEVLVATLNERGLMTEAGERWTPEIYLAEMARLGY